MIPFAAPGAVGVKVTVRVTWSPVFSDTGEASGEVSTVYGESFTVAPVTVTGCVAVSVTCFCAPEPTSTGPKAAGDVVNGVVAGLPKPMTLPTRSVSRVPT